MQKGDTILYWNSSITTAKVGVVDDISSHDGVGCCKVKDKWYFNAVKASEVEILNNILIKKKHE